MEERVCIFWDNSNIFIPAGFVALRREGGFADRAIRIYFANLYKLAHANRCVERSLCVGSMSPELKALLERLRATGVCVELYERGKESGTEQGVDQCLQVHMLRALADIDPPAVAVLLTGDGAGYEDGVGYHADLERLARRGWGVEVISWDAACNKRLKEWAQEVGVYIRLEDYYESVTFIEGGRKVAPLSLVHRPMAAPKPQKEACL